MKVFWSWQSDTFELSGRHFVKAALEAAVDRLADHPSLEDAERPSANARAGFRRDEMCIAASPVRPLCLLHPPDAIRRLVGATNVAPKETERVLVGMPQDANQRWYVRDCVAGQPRQVWLFDGRTATRIGVADAENGVGTYFKAEPGEDIWNCLRRQTSWLDPGVTEGRFHLMVLGPAEYHSRIARPNALANQPIPWMPNIVTNKAYVAGARKQLTLLVRRLEIICQTVEPSSSTLDVYGHEIRNLLILAATEAEMHWRGILAANRPSVASFNTNEYVKLVEPLRLADYKVSFQDFPSLPSIAPFAGWLKSDPTKSLKWYDAYNGVKHNREAEFDRGTLRRAFEAVSACTALLIAQFGPSALGSELSNFVQVQMPTWPVGEMYLPRVTEAAWTPVCHPSLA